MVYFCFFISSFTLVHFIIHVQFDLVVIIQEKFVKHNISLWVFRATFILDLVRVFIFSFQVESFFWRIFNWYLLHIPNVFYLWPLCSIGSSNSLIHWYVIQFDLSNVIIWDIFKFIFISFCFYSFIFKRSWILCFFWWLNCYSMIELFEYLISFTIPWFIWLLSFHSIVITWLDPLVKWLLELWNFVKNIGNILGILKEIIYLLIFNSWFLLLMKLKFTISW